MYVHIYMSIIIILFFILSNSWISTHEFHFTPLDSLPHPRLQALWPFAQMALLCCWYKGAFPGVLAHHFAPPGAVCWPVCPVFLPVCMWWLEEAGKPKKLYSATLLHFLCKWLSFISAWQWEKLTSNLLQWGHTWGPICFWLMTALVYHWLQRKLDEHYSLAVMLHLL